jgi:hypothetical protein
MTFLLPVLLVAAAPQVGDETCAATRFTLNKPVAPQAKQPTAEAKRAKVAQAVPAVPPEEGRQPRVKPTPGDCKAGEKARGN